MFPEKGGLEGADLRQGAARPQSRVLLAAGGANRTPRLLVTLLVLHLGCRRVQCRHLGHPTYRRPGARLAVAGLCFQVTHCPVGAAVGEVIAAHGLTGD